MATYAKSSPWGATDVTQNYLDIYAARFVPKDPSDLLFEITPQYTYRPDLLAFDLYGTSKWWWVFSLRNPDVIKDPVFDFKPGVKIFLPKKSLLSSSVGM